MTYYLAIDIGASNGRHILGHQADGKLVLEEIYRFPNASIKRNGQLIWDVDAITAHILEGMRRCGELGKTPASVGIDTWGVDFVLLDPEGQRLGEAVSNRDSRTVGIDQVVEKAISFAELYKRTGIQKMPFNTIYQIMALKQASPEQLERAESLLFLPDYFRYCLSGKAVSEYTIASTSALVDAAGKTWDRELIGQLGLPQGLFLELSTPGITTGTLTPEIAERVGYNCEVVLTPGHDTACAYLAVPAADENAIYLSSGTWSLMGIESPKPILTDTACEQGLTNEGGYGYRFRLLTNIMGLWMLQSVRRETGEIYSFPELAELAKDSGSPVTIVDVTDNTFFAPDSMIEAVKEVARKAGGAVPETLGQVLQCIYHSLANCYAKTVVDLGEITGRNFTDIHIVGGGSQDAYLNTLTANATGCTVHAGPTEATVVGNIMVQMITAGELADVDSGRQMVRDSFSITSISPKR